MDARLAPLLLSLLLGDPAAAADFDHYRLGAYYLPSEVAEPAVQRSLDAVVRFGGATGFLVSPDGLILTNHHVYQSFGDSGTVYRRWDGRRAAEAWRVEVVLVDARHDVALYRAQVDHPTPYLPIRWTRPVVGEPVAAIGHPDGAGQRVSLGRVLADDLTIGGRPSVEYSAQTWWGSSGSPIVDRQGRALAIHWGWDSQGISNGRLTGVPFARIAAVPGLRAMVEPGPACDDPEAWGVDSRMLAARVATSRDGRPLDQVEVSLTGQQACLARVEAVTWQLHPTFGDPLVAGDTRRPGAPILLKTWGAFDTVAEVRLQGATEPVRVPGVVAWR